MEKEHYDDICVSGESMQRYMEKGWKVKSHLYSAAESPEEAAKNSADPIKQMEAELAALKKAKEFEGLVLKSIFLTYIFK